MNVDDSDPAVVLGSAILILTIVVIWAFFKCLEIDDDNSIDTAISGKKISLKHKVI